MSNLESNALLGSIIALNLGDCIVFQKDGRKLWRMFEDEKGLYLENLSTGKVI